MRTFAVPAGKALSPSRLVALFFAAVIVFALLFGLVFAGGAQAAVGYSEEEAAFLKLINDYRASQGLSTLLVSDRISEACDRHSSDMAKYAFFSHYTVKSDWFAPNASPWDRMAASGYTYYTTKGENIAAGQSTAALVFAAWKASSGHNANMLNAQFKVVGISFHELAGSPYTFYWTTDFGGYVDSTAHTLSVPAGPATTRFQQSDSRLAYTGAWNSSLSSRDSGYPDPNGGSGSYAYINAPGSVTVKFNGTYLAWVTKKGTAYGYARVSLDGGTPVTVDLYNGSTIYQQKVWNTGTLANATHTVQIEWVGDKRAAATATNIGVDAFDVAGTLLYTDAAAPTPTATRYQQTDSHIKYATTWATFNTASASGGSYARTSANGTYATLTFNGTYFAWIATKGTTLGKAFVSLDGGAPQSVNLAASAVAYQQRVWSTGTLASGQHTVKIWRDSTSALGKYVSIDAVEVAGTMLSPSTVVSPVSRYEQTDRRLDWTGVWTTYLTSGASGGGYRRVNTSSGSVTVTFTGTYLAWIATAGTTLGTAYVSLDGGTPQLIDLARTAVAYQQNVWNTGILSSGQHTVKIWRDPNNLSGKYVSVDAFEIEGTLQ